MAARPAAGGGRWVEIEPERLPRWLSRFAERHGDPVAEVIDGTVRLTAPDGASAELYPPPGAPVPVDLADLTATAGRARRVGLVLVRRAAVAAGVSVGGELASSKVDSSYVQGRTAAGGWSQQRFARRRDNQARAAERAAADIVARLLLPEVDRLDAVVTGGDRRAVDAVLADPRLAPLAARRHARFLDVGEPRLATLRDAALRARTLAVRVSEPAATADPAPGRDPARDGDPA
jgi:hypothetical protein